MAPAASRVFAAVALSGVVHAGAAFVDWSGPSPAADDAIGRAPLRMIVARATPSRRSVATAAPASTPPPSTPTSATASVTPPSTPAPASPPVAAASKPRDDAAGPVPSAHEAPDDVEPVAVADDEPIAVVAPKPISYPVFTLPENDDPHRIGLTRLVLVVSSTGETVDVVVTASTMSQDYVDRLVRTFSAMRFEPARARGLPRPGTYEVVVNFAFEPSGRSAL